MSEREACRVCGCPVATSEDWFQYKGGERPDLCWEPGEALCRSVGEALERPVYDPTTHRLVPKDAVVLENAYHTLRLAELVVDRWIKRGTQPSGRPVDIFERGAEKTAELVAARLRSALAGEADTVEGEGDDG